MNNIVFIMSLLLAGLALPKAMAQKTSKVNQEDLKVIELRVTGMTCAGCSNHISNALLKLDGVISDEVRYPGNLAIVTFDPQAVKVKEIIKTIETAGYKAQILKKENKKKSQSGEE